MTHSTRLLLALSLTLVPAAVGCAHGTPHDHGTATVHTSGDEHTATVRTGDDHTAATHTTGDGHAEGAHVRTRDTDHDGTDDTVAVTDTGLTAMDQGESAADVETTRQIRAAVVGDSSLSLGARNCVIITRDGHVTLRGDVTMAESATIERHARAVAGVLHVDNSLNPTDRAAARHGAGHS